MFLDEQEKSLPLPLFQTRRPDSDSLLFDHLKSEIKVYKNGSSFRVDNSPVLPSSQILLTSPSQKPPEPVRTGETAVSFSSSTLVLSLDTRVRDRRFCICGGFGRDPPVSPQRFGQSRWSIYLSCVKEVFLGTGHSKFTETDLTYTNVDSTEHRARDVRGIVGVHLETSTGDVLVTSSNTSQVGGVRGRDERSWKNTGTWRFSVDRVVETCWTRKSDTTLGPSRTYMIGWKDTHKSVNNLWWLHRRRHDS